MNKKLLIIGGSSNLGRNFIPLLKNIHQSTYFNNKIIDGIHFNILQDDISKKININDYSAVLLLSAITNPETCIKNKDYSNLLNVISLKKIIKFLIGHRIKIIFFSTEFIYDGKKGNYNEKDFPNPINLYGAQKYNIENFIKENTNNYSILRIAKTYTDNVDSKSMFGSWYKKIILEKIGSIDCFEDQLFSPLFALDLGFIIDNIIDQNFIGTINVGGPQKLSRLDCLELFLSIFKIKNISINKIKIEEVKLLDNWPKDVSFDTKKLKDFLNKKTVTVENVLINLYKSVK